MKIGLTELVVVFVVALLVIGPDKLPSYAKKLGTALAEFRKASESLTKDFQETVVAPLEEAQRPLREAIEPLEELEKGVRSDVKEMQNSLNNIGKPKKSAPKAPDAEEHKAPAQTPAPQEETQGEGATEELPAMEASAQAPQEEIDTAKTMEEM